METEYIAPLTNSYNGMNVDAIREKSRERLQHYLATNLQPAREGLHRIFTEVPEDVALRKIHIGGRLGEGIAYSQETQDANEKADALATGDTVRHLLGPAYRDTLVAGIREANDRKVDAKARAEGLVKSGKLSKEEGKRAAEVFLTPDIEMLPPGQSVWRWSNTLSYMAGEQTDAYRRLDLERLAGEALT